MNNSNGQHGPRAWVPGLSFILAGLVGLGLSFVHGNGGFATQHDPGPWMLPRLLGLILMVGGLSLVLASRSKPVAENSIVGPEVDARPSEEKSPTWILPALIGGMAAYIAALPRVGFVISTAAFAMGLLCVLKIVWWRALLAGILLAAIAYGLFSVVLKVPLPAGAWN